MTLSIINQVNCFAMSEQMPSGLKITNQTDITLYTLTMIAGVDYTNNSKTNDNHDDNHDAYQAALRSIFLQLMIFTFPTYSGRLP